MQTLGIIDLTWRGRTIDAEKGSKVKLGGLKQNVVTTGRRVHHADEMEASEITATIVLPRGMKLSDIFVRGEGDLIARCDSGQTYAWPDAFITNRPEMTGGEGGKIQIVWAAGEPTEMTSG